MKWDPTISLGTVLNLAGLLVTLVFLGLKLERRLSSMETKVAALWKWFVGQVPDVDR